VEQGDLSLACAAALVDELVSGGVRHACLSPGSRSTPLALALARHHGIELHVHLDERSGAYVALGITKATGSPAIVATTSGTAVAELLPAVVEASQARVPLLLLTADRPPRLRGTGANQTIVQTELFGSYARASLDLPVPAAAGQEAWWRQAGREALLAAAEAPVGPVHLNCPFEEPLVPEGRAVAPAGEGPPSDASTARASDASEPPEPPAEPVRLAPEESERLAELVSGARGAVVVGGLPGTLDPATLAWPELLGWPVLAEPTSNARLPGHALAAGQSLVGSTWAPAHRPEVVIQLGAAPTTRAMQAFVSSAGRLVVADRWHLDPDPEHLAWWRVAIDPGSIAEALASHPVADRAAAGRIAIAGARESADRRWAGRILPSPDGWTAAWRRADDLARATLDELLDRSDEPFEPRVARDVAAWLPDGGLLVVGNSTPVRDLDLAMSPRAGLTVLANRGASGIDGLVSTALGVAVARRGPTVALLGDLSFLHDLGALAWNARRGTDLTVVVVNNAGGHVFDLLPQRELPEHEDLFVTPHGADLGALAAAAGAGHERVERASDLPRGLDRAAAAGGVRIVEVVVDAALGLRRRAELRDAVDRALAG
jgi:2-succinyl-5-enolpyruvyl-6-hydroxy-3-cyclohexene-1-carboxylate synthase